MADTMRIKISIEMAPQDGDSEGLKFTCQGSKCPSDLMEMGAYVGKLVQEKVVAAMPGIPAVYAENAQLKSDKESLKAKLDELKQRPAKAEKPSASRRSLSGDSTKVGG